MCKETAAMYLSHASGESAKHVEPGKLSSPRREEENTATTSRMLGFIVRHSVCTLIM